MKTLILGANGMLGHALQETFSGATAWDLPELDITNNAEVQEKIGAFGLDIVINAAAFTDVDGAEENEEVATRINGDAVGFVADVCLKIGARMIHYSTDYVFSGNNPKGYEEDETPDEPVNAYGRSKFEGERAILERIQKGLQGYIIRTSWLFGPHGKNFVDTMVRLGKEKEGLRVVNDQHGKPTYTVDLALVTKEILEGDRPPGVYHVTNETPLEGITWFDFAAEIVRLSDGSARVEPCSSEEYPLPAKRPQYSMLMNTKLSSLRSWEIALRDYLVSNGVG